MPDKPKFDYFYGIEADQFTFYRIPKELFTNIYFADLSTDAKLLYGLMLDRMSLSRKNEWLDDANRVYIIFTQEDAREFLKCSKNKIVTYFAELDNYGLILRKKQGQGKPAIIYVMNIYNVIKTDKSNADKSNATEEEPLQNENPTIPDKCIDDLIELSEPQTSEILGKSRPPKSGSQDFPNQEVKTSQIRKSRPPKLGSQDFPNQDLNNNKLNNIELNNTELNNTNSTASNLDDIIKLFKSVIHTDLDWQQKQNIKEWLSKIPIDLIVRKINRAKDKNIPEHLIYAYVESAILSYIENGLYTLDQVEAAEKECKTNLYSAGTPTTQVSSSKNKNVVHSVRPRGIFNNYNQKIYSPEEIDEIMKKKLANRQNDIPSEDEINKLLNKYFSKKNIYS